MTCKLLKTINTPSDYFKGYIKFHLVVHDIFFWQTLSLLQLLETKQSLKRSFQVIL